MDYERIKNVLGEEFCSFVESYEYDGKTHYDFCRSDDERDEEYNEDEREFYANAFSDFMKECSFAFLEGTSGKDTFWQVKVDVF